jgi:hypothetical protein
MTLITDFKRVNDSVGSIVQYFHRVGVAVKLFRLIKMCLNETYSKVHISTNFCDAFPIQNGIKKGYALSPLFFNFPSEYAIRTVQENNVGLKLNGLYELLVYADVDLLADNTDIIKNKKFWKGDA